MDLFSVFAILSASAVNSIMPGPCLAVTIGRSAAAGVTTGFVVVLGILAANVILAAAALLVIQGVLAMSAVAFETMRWGGIAILLALALKMLCNRPPDTGVARARSLPCMGDLATGLCVGLSSPYNLVFLLALLPQAISQIALDGASTLLIITAVAAGAMLSYGGAVLVGHVSGAALEHRSGLIERVAAIAMVGFAVLASQMPTQF